MIHSPDYHIYMTTPVSDPATSVVFRARALTWLQSIVARWAARLRMLVARREGRTSPLGVGIQLVGAAALFYGLHLYSPPVAFGVFGVLALVAGEKL